jgi:hypothetical protein
MHPTEACTQSHRSMYTCEPRGPAVGRYTLCIGLKPLHPNHRHHTRLDTMHTPLGNSTGIVVRMLRQRFALGGAQHTKTVGTDRLLLMATLADTHEATHLASPLERSHSGRGWGRSQYAVTFHRAYQVLPGVHELKVQLKRANKAKNTAVRSPLPSFQFPAARVESREAECRHPTGRERTGSPTLQTLQDPILLLQWLCFLVAAFRTLVKVCPHPPAAAPLSPSDASGATHSLRTGARATGAGAAGAARRGGVGRDHTAHDELVPGCQDRPIRAQGGHLPPQGTQYNRTNWLLWFGVSAGWASPSSRGLWGDDALLENSLASLPPPPYRSPGTVPGIVHTRPSQWTWRISRRVKGP